MSPIFSHQIGSRNHQNHRIALGLKQFESHQVTFELKRIGHIDDEIGVLRCGSVNG